jgi:hypothetical protein
MDRKDCSLPSKTVDLLHQLDEMILHRVKNETRSKILLLELHGSVPGMTYLAPYIHRWRQMAFSHNQNFFAFTLVREPLQLSISYFRFFHVNCPHRWCERQQFNSTVDGLLSSVRLLPNRQCTSLHQRQSFTLLKPSIAQECVVTDCQAVTRLTEQAMDWIGTTERLSSDTIPLLSYMLTRSKVANATNEKVSSPDISLQKMTGTERRELEGFLHMDLQLYDHVKQQYSINKTFCL